MMERTILLLHPDRYFTKGLEHLLIQWFCSQNISVNITEKAITLENTDIIFTTPHSHSKKWWQQYQRTRHYPLLFLLVEQKDILCCGYEDGQLAVSDTPETLSRLLTTVVTNQRPHRTPFSLRQSTILNYLSPREREVLWGYKLGLDNHQISNRSGMSIKAISAYRNNAMQKLLLKNHADLHYWLHTVAAENLSSFFKGKGLLNRNETLQKRAVHEKK